MTTSGLLVVLGIGRMLGYLGFALLGGALLCWSTSWSAWADDQSDGSRWLARAGRLGSVGLALSSLLALAAVAGLANGSPIGRPSIALDLIGGSALLRLAVLIALVFFVPELTRSAITRDRRILGLLVVALLAFTLLLGSPLVQQRHWALLTWAGGWQLLGLAGLLGAGGWLILLVRRPVAGGRPSRLVLTRMSVIIVLSSAALAGSVIIGTAVAAASGSGLGWAIAIVVGAAGAIVLSLLGSRRARTVPQTMTSSAASTGAVRTSGTGLLAAGLAVGAAVMIITSWWPGGAG